MWSRSWHRSQHYPLRVLKMARQRRNMGLMINLVGIARRELRAGVPPSVVQAQLLAQFNTIPPADVANVIARETTLAANQARFDRINRGQFVNLPTALGYARTCGTIRASITVRFSNSASRSGVTEYTAEVILPASGRLTDILQQGINAIQLAAASHYTIPNVSSLGGRTSGAYRVNYIECR